MTPAAIRRKHLLNPPNGRHSDETEIVPTAIWLQRQERKFDEKRDNEVRAAIRAAVQAKIDEYRHTNPLPATDHLLAQAVAPNAIIYAVAEYYGIPLVDLVSDRRQAPLVSARHIAMYLCRHHTMKSFVQIGLAMGRFDHSTVINGVAKIDQRLKAEPQLRDDIAELRQRLGLYPARVSVQPENAGGGD